MGTTQPVINKKGHPIAKGCLLIIGVFILLGFTGYFYLRSPHFSGSTPTSIDIAIQERWVFPPNTNSSVRARITSVPACVSLFELLRSARCVLGCKCIDVGSFTIRYPDGKTDTLAFLPGHDPTGYEFRDAVWQYRLPRNKFYQVLRDVGVDPTRMPVNKD